ncbi:hypothetical protein INR79_09695 [Vibrio sp. SCSIO 43132]|uniref:hypothetical protein n=1 Tax=Vibrio sp. SCSIO 43132 TaxID=2779363 RepID=UPI001CA9854D|nr:hypothetical protein [Vibrio sp. SCSIO 43132]UAB68820.1 hypothetical protein INR79_09695 [Vibrio sp. SCSIO 43132]
MIPPFTNSGAMPMDLSGGPSAAKSSNSIGGASQGAINMGGKASALPWILLILALFYIGVKKK